MRTRTRRGQPAIVLLLGSTLLLTACGARLSPEQRSQALAANGSKVVTTGGDALGAVEGGNAAGPSAGPVVGGPAAVGGTGGTGSGPGTTGGTAGTAGTAGTSGTKGTAGGSSGTGTGATGDTRKAPPGGNGGATDKGITADSITIANISDISGAVPGLFEDAQLAVKAYFAYFNAREGTIYGRKIKLLSLDSRLDAGGNREQSIKACNEAFAGVGSVSAFDQGGAPVIRDCGLADLRGLATTEQMKTVPNAYAVDPAGTGGKRSLSVFGWAKERFPEAIKKAAYIYIDGEVTRQLTEQDVEGAEAVLGYKFIAKPAIGITETNYGPVVQQLKSKDAQYVTFVGAYQQAASLAQEFQRQGYKPQVFQPTVTAYTPDFIKQAGAAAENVYVAVKASLNEEVSGNPELTTYTQWLNQVKPGATPTGIGQFAWGAAALFVEKMKVVGPRPTRKALLAEIARVRNFTANGLLPPSDVGSRELGTCTKIVQVKNGKFVRVEPTAVGTNRCKDLVYNTKTKRGEPGAN
jgi:ABC-type branched-subunit amino acid transport system substrate-binding protein